MYLFLFVLPSIQAIDSPAPHTKIFLNKVDEIKTIDIIEKQTKRIFDYANSNHTISMKITQNQSFCHFVEKTVLFNDHYSANYKFIQRPNSSVSEEEENNNPINFNSPNYYEQYPILGQIAETYHGSFIGRSDFKLLFVHLDYINGQYQIWNSTIDYKHLMNNTSQVVELPQLIYDSINSVLFIIYPHQLLYGLVSSGNITLLSHPDFNSGFLGNCRCNKGFLFIPLGSQGLDIYQIQINGNLKYILNYKTPGCMIVDVSFSTLQNVSQLQLLLILDRYEGIRIQKVNYMQFSLQLAPHSKIDLVGGSLITSFKNFVMVLSENLSDNYIIEYSLQQDKVFIMSNHSLDSKYFDIEITDEFAIIKGIDAHIVLFHSLYSQFDIKSQNTITDESWLNEQEHESNIFQFLFLPLLQSFKVHDNKILKIANNKLEEINTTYPYILGVTQNSLVIIEFQVDNSYIECSLPTRESLKGKQFQIQIDHNSTDCKQKTEFIEQQKGQVYENLMMCVNIEEWWILPQESYSEMQFDYQIYSTVVLLGFICLIVIILIFLKCYKRFRLKEELITQNLQELENKGYSNENASI